MKLIFPSWDFDEAVAAVCHGTASEDQMSSLRQLLQMDSEARDEYILRMEVHSRLASDPDLFARDQEYEHDVVPMNPARGTENTSRRRWIGAAWVMAAAACIGLFAVGWWVIRGGEGRESEGATSKAVAMLNRVVGAEWLRDGESLGMGSALEPGILKLKEGLAQIVFYSGARVVIEGPAEVELISPAEVRCLSGRLIAEVPAQARGFRVGTPNMTVTDLGTVFGVAVSQPQTELHVFQGKVEFVQSGDASKQGLLEGQGAIADGTGQARRVTASPVGFASLFDLQNKSTAAEVLRHEQWRSANLRLDEDPSLLVHFDFEPVDAAGWTLVNSSLRKGAAPDATIVGCSWTQGRWSEKSALEFRGVSDRVRMTVPDDYTSLTLAMWVRVQGLDRQINSLFMSDGFEAGTLHWCIRRDGVLGLTAIGSEPGRFQICTSPPALTLDQLGRWMHLAVVVDGDGMKVTHYLNGVALSVEELKIHPPFRVGMAELGNWNALGFPRNDPFMIRNFSGAMDEFCMFSRALSAEQIRALYSGGKPQPDAAQHTRK